MERKVTKLEHSHVEVLVTVDSESWKAAQDKAFKKLAANVKVDGFRKGKAPEHLIKDRVDHVKVLDEAINALLPEIYRDIIEKDGVRPYAQPKVDVTKVTDTELEVKFVLVVAPEVKLGAYKGLEIGKETVEATEEDVNAAVEATLNDNATLVVKEDAAKSGDTVVMDFVGKINGEVFEGGSAENHELVLGSNSFIPGFEDQLIGHKAGEVVEVNVKFPENYTAELKGKDATFTCTIHEVKEKKLPELNDEFVKELKLEGVETVEQFKERKKADVQKQKEQEAHNKYLNKVIDAVAKSSTVDLPEEIINNQVSARKKDVENRMQQSGLTLQQYLDIVGQKEEDFMKKLTEDVTKDTINYLVLEEIGKAENITIDDATLEAELTKISEQYKMPLENVKKALANNMGEFVNNLKMQRIEDLLYTENK